jgi:Fic family protein
MRQFDPWPDLAPDEPLQAALAQVTELWLRLKAARPLPPEAVRNLKEYFDVAWTHHSTAIEGNTLTESETRAVLLDGVTIAGKSLREHLEVINHRAAIARLEEMAHQGAPLTEAAIRELHALVMHGIDDAQAGRYRAINVRISGSSYLPPEAHEVPRWMGAFAAWLESVDTLLAQEPELLHPVIAAGRAHHRLVYIHPFADGNGRTARLLMNLVLIRCGYPPAVIRVDERPRYYATLEQASLTGDDRPFLRLVTEATQRSLDIVLHTVRAR